MSNGEEVRWRSAKRCTNGTCVEVAKVGDRYLMRDSKDPDGAILSFPEDEWESFIAGVKEGDFSFD